ncbi:MAG: CvpA family protein [Treponema sp.]|jgi:membrane protein required for colicin V production|nr:CvpA family protein [Treponema sp.]
MEVIDIIFAALMAIVVVRCALRGFVEAVMSMAAVVLGLGCAFVFHKKGADFLTAQYIPDMKVLPEVLAFVVIFLVVFLAVKLVEFILKDIITRINFGGVDRFLGALFGFVEGAVLISLVIFVLSMQPLFDIKPALEKSYFARILAPFIGTARDAIKFPGEV